MLSLILNKDDSAELLIYDVIGKNFWSDPENEITGKTISDKLKEAKSAKTINVRINSPGGVVFDGFTIYELLRQSTQKINVYIDGLAASAASVIAMAGDTITIADNGFIMIHEPHAFAGGTSSEFRKQADLMDKVRDQIVNVYQSRSNLTKEQIENYMRDETWFNADESIAFKLADKVSKSNGVKNMTNLLEPFKAYYKNIPQINNGPSPEELAEHEKRKELLARLTLS